jgi:hypothetical protein
VLCLALPKPPTVSTRTWHSVELCEHNSYDSDLIAFVAIVGRGARNE